MSRDGDRPPATADWPRGVAEASGWPLLAAFGLASLYGALGLLLLGARRPSLALAIGSTLLSLVAIAGWLCQGLAHERAGPASAVTARTATILFLCVEAATFGTGLVYYAFVLLGSRQSWQVPATSAALVAALTLLLAASSLLLAAATRADRRGDRSSVVSYLRTTTALGALFVLGQAGEYYVLLTSGVSVADGSYATALFGLTGLHVLHVVGGLGLLGVVLARLVAYGSSPGPRTDLATVSTYWHFVTGTWVVLVVALYVAPAVIG